MQSSSTIKHLLIAAESGDAAAQFNLGVLYDSRLDDNGYAIEGNRAEAMKWLLAAAEQGLPVLKVNSPKCMRVAEPHQKTLSMPVPGFSWRQRACAEYIARRLDSNTRVSSHLTPGQLATAKRLAGDWHPKKPDNTPRLGHRKYLRAE
jgi:TPR repeat protein